MSDWEEEPDDSRSTSQNAYFPPSGRGWYNSFDRNEAENLSDGRRPGFGRGRANRFGNPTENRNECSSPGKRNSYSEDGNTGGFGRGESGFGRKQFSRGGDVNADGVNWRDRGNRDNPRGFGRNRGGQGRERNSTEIMVPSDDVRYIIG